MRHNRKAKRLLKETYLGEDWEAADMLPLTHEPPEDRNEHPEYVDRPAFPGPDLLDTIPDVPSSEDGSRPKKS